jgi:uncharacterized YccA/Bax inhibitor family protein
MPIGSRGGRGAGGVALVKRRAGAHNDRKGQAADATGPSGSRRPPPRLGETTLATFATTGNPAFRNEAFPGYTQVFGHDGSAVRSNVMTVQGTVGKTSLLLAILSATAIWSWVAASQGQVQPGLFIGALVGGLVLAFVTIFKPTLAPWTAPLYAAFEGVVLGLISYMIEHSGIRGAYPGIALQAVTLTFGVLLVMLMLYTSRVIVVTDRLRMGIVAATGALCLVYVGSFLLSLCGVPVPFLRNSSLLGIGISLFVVGLAAFNLLLDFDFIDRAAQRGAPKVMEWYGAFGLIVTLVWLYLEILRLLQQLQSRR